jgi:hypothetical protein
LGYGDFFQKTDTTLQWLSYIGSDSIIFSDPMKMMQFPMTYNQVYTDSFAGTYFSSAQVMGNSHWVGALSSVIDGYGTLVLPKGTYYNVLRQKIVFQIMSVTGSDTVIRDNVHYKWITPGVHHYLLDVQNLTITGTTQSFVYYSNEKPNQLSLKNNNGLNQHIEVFPNPSTSHITIQATEAELISVQICNLLGQVILGKQVSVFKDKMDIDVMNLNAGCYFLKINTNQGQITKQVIIR